MKARLPLSSRSWPWIGLPTLALMVYLFSAWFIFEPGAPWSPDEGIKLLQMVSLRIENEALRFDIPYPGQWLDPELDFALSEHPKDLLNVVDGRLMLERLPIFPLLSLPFYRWIGIYGLYLLPALAGAIIGPLALGLIERWERHALMWALIAFGGPVFIYASLFWEHTLAAALGLAGVWIVFRVCFGNYRDGQDKFQAIETAPTSNAASQDMLLAVETAPRRNLLLQTLAFLAAASMGAAAYLRPETLLLSAAALGACWLLQKERRAWLLLSSALLGMILLPYRPLHASLFAGNGLPANARYIYRPMAYLRSAGWQALPDLLIGPSEDGGVEPSGVGLLWTGAAALAVGASLIPRKNTATRTVTRLGLGLCAVTATCFLFTRTPYRAAHGLLFTTPWALLGLTRARQAWREGSPRMKAVTLTALLGLLGYALMMIAVRGSSPHGGLEWGARFALPLYPLLALITVWDLFTRLGSETNSTHASRTNAIRIDIVLIGLLVCLGIGFQARGLLTIQRDKQINAALNQAILATAEEYVVTDLWWLLPNAAHIYPQKALYTARTPWEIAAWAERADGQGVQRFDLVTLNYALPAAVKGNLPEYEIKILEMIQVEELLIFRISVQRSKHSAVPCNPFAGE